MRTEDDDRYVHRAEHAELVSFLEEAVLALISVEMRRERRRRRGREEGEGVDKNREIAKIVISTKIVLICAKLRSKCARTLRNVTERFRSCCKSQKGVSAAAARRRGGGRAPGNHSDAQA